MLKTICAKVTWFCRIVKRDFKLCLLINLRTVGLILIKLYQFGRQIPKREKERKKEKYITSHHRWPLS